MKRMTIFLIGIILSFQGFSQDQLFVLHPLVGDTIDRNEKLNYLLFRDIEDSDFRYCTISYSTDGYFVRSHTLNDSVNIKQIDSTEINQYISNLNKVMEYYSNQGKRDSIKSTKKLTLNFNDKNPILINNPILGEEAKEKIFQEVRSTNRLKGDAERLKSKEEGTDRISGSGRIEFYKKRKKRN